MAILAIMCLVFGFVFCCLASKKIGAPNWEFGWLGMAFLILSFLLPAIANFKH